MRIKPCFEYQCIWNPVIVGEKDPSWHGCTGDSSFGLYQVCSWNGHIVAPQTPLLYAVEATIISMP